MCVYKGGGGVLGHAWEGNDIVRYVMHYWIRLCNVSCIALLASRMYSHRGIWHIRRAFLLVLLLLLISILATLKIAKCLLIISRDAFDTLRLL